MLEQQIADGTLSPSMRRAWIEIPILLMENVCPLVALHAEGVD